MDQNKTGGIALASGGLAAILASACCVGPLLLVSIGLGGAWLSNLQALEPYQPIFIGIALVALFIAYRRLLRPAAACEPGQVCAVPAYRTVYRIVFWAVAALVLAVLALPYIAPLFY